MKAAHKNLLFFLFFLGPVVFFSASLGACSADSKQERVFCKAIPLQEIDSHLRQLVTEEAELRIGLMEDERAVFEDSVEGLQELLEHESESGQRKLLEGEAADVLDELYQQELQARYALEKKIRIKNQNSVLCAFPQKNPVVAVYQGDLLQAALLWAQLVVEIKFTREVVKRRKLTIFNAFFDNPERYIEKLTPLVNALRSVELIESASGVTKVVGEIAKRELQVFDAQPALDLEMLRSIEEKALSEQPLALGIMDHIQKFFMGASRYENYKKNQEYLKQEQEFCIWLGQEHQCTSSFNPFKGDLLRPFIINYFLKLVLLVLEKKCVEDTSIEAVFEDTKAQLQAYLSAVIAKKNNIKKIKFNDPIVVEFIQQQIPHLTAFEKNGNTYSTIGYDLSTIPEGPKKVLGGKGEASTLDIKPFPWNKMPVEVTDTLRSYPFKIPPLSVITILRTLKRLAWLKFAGIDNVTTLMPNLFFNLILSDSLEGKLIRDFLCIPNVVSRVLVSSPCKVAACAAALWLEVCEIDTVYHTRWIHFVATHKTVLIRYLQALVAARALMSVDRVQGERALKNAKKDLMVFVIKGHQGPYGNLVFGIDKAMERDVARSESAAKFNRFVTTALICMVAWKWRGWFFNKILPTFLRPTAKGIGLL